MKILIVSPYMPHPQATHAGGLTLYNYFKHLSKKHQLYLLSFARKGETLDVLKGLYASAMTVPYKDKKELAGWGALSLLASRAKDFLRSIACDQPYFIAKYCRTEFSRKLLVALEQWKPDTVQFEFSQLSPYASLVADVPKVLDLHELGTKPALRKMENARHPLKKAFLRWQLNKWRRFEASYYRNFQRIITVTQEDAHQLAELIGDPHAKTQRRIKIIHHGVDTEIFKPKYTPKIPGSVVFIGNFEHDANLDAIAYFTEKIWLVVRKRMPDTRLYVLGKNPPNYLHKMSAKYGVEVPGFIGDLPDFLDRMQVSVIPLRLGGGIKVKLLQSLAMQLGVVTTSVGLEGIDAVDGQHLCLADDEQLFARRVVELLADEKLRKRMGKAGRELVGAEYSVARMIAELEELYQDLDASGDATEG